MKHIAIEVPDLEILQEGAVRCIFDSSDPSALDQFSSQIIYEELTDVLNVVLGYGSNVETGLAYLEDLPYSNELIVFSSNLEQRNDWQFITRYHDVKQVRVVRFDLCLYIQIS